MISDGSLNFARLKTWGMKGGIAVTEQAIFSSANFIVNILLARWLMPEEYGAYALGYSALLFYLQFLISFILDPMAVLGPAEYPEKLADYLGLEIRLYFYLIGLLGCIQAVIMIIMKQFGINYVVCNIFILIGFSLTFLLLPWLLRRVFYVLGKLYIALEGSIIYALILTILVVFLNKLSYLSSTTSILIIALAGALCGIFLIANLKRFESHNLDIPVREIFFSNWKMGKWLILYSICITFASQIQIWLSASILGLQESGILRAIEIIPQPMMLTITALTAVMIPNLSYEFSKDNFKRFNQKVLLLSVILLIVAVVFEFLLLLFYVRIEYFVYNGKYSAYSALLPIWGLVPLFLAYSSGLQAGLQSAQMPKTLLVSSVVWASVSFVLGVALTLKFGIWGTSWSALFGYLVYVTTITRFYFVQIYQPLVSKN